MNVSTCPLLFKILAQSFITVVSWVFRNYVISWMHVDYLTGVYIYQDEPWYLNMLCVQVTCKVHKSRKPGDNFPQVTCHSSWKGDHSFGISPVSIDCWKRWANTGPNSVASSFRTLRWSSSGPKALEGFKPLRSLITPSLETAISFMKGADLSRSGTWVCSFFIEHIRKLTVELLCLFEIRLSNTLSILPFQGWNTLGVFFSDYWCTDRSLWDLP